MIRFKIGLIIVLVTFWVISTNAQNTYSKYTADLSLFHGSILRHNSDISHLIIGHPRGFVLGLNKKTFGEKSWHQEFGYPDLGFDIVYQDMQNPTLGWNAGFYAHANFYFLNRSTQLRVGQGVAYNSNPYDREANFRNNAYGSHLLSSTFFMLHWQQPRLFGPIGFRAGLSLVHYSNANVKAPNTSTNTLALSAGVVYDFESENPDYRFWDAENLKEPVSLNLAFRTGINESDVIGSGQFPFYNFSLFAEKRLGKLSSIQVGGDLFFSRFLKELIRFQSTSFPEFQVNFDADYRRAGLFLGHELYLGQTGLITQLGYYFYYPFDFEGRLYNRIGLQHHFGRHWSAGVSLKSHWAKAEAVELGIGYRF